MNLFMHLLVASCMCPDWGSNMQPWHIGTMTQPTDLPSQGWLTLFKVTCKRIFPDFSINIYAEKMQTNTDFSEICNFLTDSNLRCYCDSLVYFSTWKLRANSVRFCSQLIGAAEGKKNGVLSDFWNAAWITQFYEHYFWGHGAFLTIYYSLSLS